MSKAFQRLKLIKSRLLHNIIQKISKLLSYCPPSYQVYNQNNEYF